MSRWRGGFSCPTLFSIILRFFMGRSRDLGRSASHNTRLELCSRLEMRKKLLLVRAVFEFAWNKMRQHPFHALTFYKKQKEYLAGITWPLPRTRHYRQPSFYCSSPHSPFCERKYGCDHRRIVFQYLETSVA